jgi:phosphoribosylformylglycinamidine cyclo-ligase
LAGFGKTVYEEDYNSGIASNGLTSARHDMLNNYYGSAFPESYDPNTPEHVRYIGKNKLTDSIAVNYDQEVYDTNIGKLLLSPTRTFAPFVKELMEQHFEAVHGMVHCSGGGQTKCMKFVKEGMLVIKDNLFPTPPIFSLIQESSGASDREMYQVFNMGCRMEIFTKPSEAEKLIALAVKADLCDEYGTVNYEYGYTDEIVAYGKLVAAAERERFCSYLRQFHDTISLASDPEGLKKSENK